MKKIFRNTVAGLAASALVAGVLTAPQAAAEAPKTTDVNLPLACYVYPKGRAAWLKTALDMGNDFALSMKATAPETVEVGDEFEYVIDPGTVVLPTEMKAQGQTVEAKYISQANLWIDLPENVELVSFEYDKTTPLKFNVLQDGNRLRFVGENRRDDSHTVGPVGFTGKPVGDNPAEWAGKPGSRWFYGGAHFNAGDAKRGKLPKVTLKLKATGSPGSTAQATIRNADAKNNPPEAFVQGLLNGKIAGRTFNGLARCGLSEDYTGRSARKAPATPFPAVTIVEKPEPTPEPEPSPEPSEEPTPEPPSSEPTSPESETPKESEPTKSSESSTTEKKPSEDPKPSSTKTEPTKEPEPSPTKSSTSKSEPTKDPETPKESTTSTTSTTTTSQAESTTPTKESEPSKSSESSTTETKTSEDPKPSTTKTEPTKEPEPSPTKPSTSKSEPTKEPETPKESTTPTTSTTTTSQAESTTPTKESEPSKETETSKDSETSTTEAPSSETEPTKEPETATETTTPTTSPTTTTTTTPAPQNGSSGSSDGSGDSDFSSNPVRKGFFIAFWVALGLLGLTAFGNWLKQHCDFKWPF